MRRRAFLLVLGLAACGGRQAPDETHPEPPPVIVEVKNLYALPVTIQVSGNGSLYRLGTVHPGMTATFTIPTTLTLNGSAELVVLPNQNARPFTSGPLLLNPGAVVDLLVQPRLFNSTATVRP